MLVAVASIALLALGWSYEQSYRPPPNVDDTIEGYLARGVRDGVFQYRLSVHHSPYGLRLVIEPAYSANDNAIEPAVFEVSGVAVWKAAA